MESQGHQDNLGGGRVVSTIKTKSSRDKLGISKSLRVVTVVLLFSIAILLIAIAFSIYYGGTNESKYVNPKDVQAVVVGSGGSTENQLYFGSIRTLNDKYIILDNVYYIPPSTSSTASLTLEPLVCQVDAPFDQIVISTNNVSSWENLQPTGKIAMAIAQYERDNPNGPTCPASTSGNVKTE